MPPIDREQQRVELAVGGLARATARQASSTEAAPPAR